MDERAHELVRSPPAWACPPARPSSPASPPASLYFRACGGTRGCSRRAAAATMTIALTLGRFVVLGCSLALASLQGAAPLLVMALGVLLARCGHAQRVARRAMTSPLASVALFHLGPVPITAACSSPGRSWPRWSWASFSSPRRLALVRRRPRRRAELIVETVDARSATRCGSSPRPIAPSSARCSPSSSSPTGPARSRRRAADRASRDRCRAGAAGLPRGDLVRHPRRRPARLSRDLRLAQPDHDPAEFR